MKKNMLVKPKSISRPKPYLLQAEWADGYKSVISLESFRKACPCATCTGEAIGEKVYAKPQAVKNEPGAFELIDLKPIGNYAIAAAWASGHNTGIYTWEKFREIFELNTITPDQFEELEQRFAKEKKKIQLKVM